MPSNRLRPSDDTVVEAHTRLIEIGVDPVYAGKVLIGLACFAWDLDAFLTRAVSRGLQWTPNNLLQALANWQRLRDGITALGPTTPPGSAYLAGYRDAITVQVGTAFNQAVAQLPPGWPWVIRHIWLGQRWRKTHPDADLFMALIRAHLHQCGIRMTPARYQTLVAVTRSLICEAFTPGRTDVEAIPSAKTRITRCLEAIKQKEGVDRRTLVASVDRWPEIINNLIG